MKIKYSTIISALFISIAAFADSVAAPIDIPTGVFVGLGLPDIGKGIGGPNKHSTWALNPLDGRLYQYGGDFDSTEPDSAQSYQQTQYSLSIAERWANRSDPNAGWRKEYPYCGPNGGVQPKSPDFTGWTWDSRRNVFWMMPGTFVSPIYATCSDRTPSTIDDPKYLFNHIMTFDPSQEDLTKRWKDISSNRGPYVVPPEQWMSHYDPVTDSIIRLSRDTGGEANASHYNIQAGTWTTYNFGLNAAGRTMYIEKEGSAIDLVARVIYTGDGVSGRLYRYNIDAHTMTDLGALPGGANPSNPDNNEIFAWDTTNRVLFYFGGPSSRLYIFHPDTALWETPPIVTDPPGLTPKVRHALVYDPQQNVLALLGNNEGDPHIYFFRYKNGPVNGGTKIPASPTGLSVR